MNHKCESDSCSFCQRISMDGDGCYPMVTYLENHVVITTTNGSIEMLVLHALLSGRAPDLWRTQVYECDNTQTLRDIAQEFVYRLTESFTHNNDDEAEANHSIMVAKYMEEKA